MARNVTQQGLSAGNIIFLYRVLRDEIGAGKQTFITRVEEVLAAERLSADDLGFDSTQQLLEHMGDCIKLTVFKGGRIYATVVSQPSWDEALAASDKGTDKKVQGKGNKPWKKKKGDKALKPVCPKRVKREAPRDNAVPATDPATAPVSAPEPEPAPNHAPDHAPEPEPEHTPDHAPVTGINANDAPHNGPLSSSDHSTRPVIRNDRFSLDDPQAPGPESSDPGDGQDANAADKSSATASDPATSTPMAPETPGISLTVTYNPYTGEEQETVLKASPARTAKVDDVQGDASEPKTTSEPKNHGTASARVETHGKTDAAAAPEKQEQATQGEPLPHRENATGQGRPADEVKRDPAPSIEPSKPAASGTSDEPTACEPCLAAPSDSDAPAAIDAAPATQRASVPPQDNAPEAAAVQIKVALPADPKPANQLPDDLPVDFTTDVYCPGDLLHQLTLLYPYGADVLGILGEYFHIDCDRGSIKATRRRATFTARFVQDSERKDVRVRIVRRDDRGMGPTWAIDKVSMPTE